MSLSAQTTKRNWSRVLLSFVHHWVCGALLGTSHLLEKDSILHCRSDTSAASNADLKPGRAGVAAGSPDGRDQAQFAPGRAAGEH